MPWASARLVVLVALGLSASVAPGLAQQAPRPEAEPAGPPSVGIMSRAEDQARLGVYLRSGCDIGPMPPGECTAPPIVTSVIDATPAAMVGVQPGDTLLALDGVALDTGAGRRALAGLRAGEPVMLRIGRESGRRELRVTPEARPMSGLFHLTGPTWRATAPSTVQVFRLREEDGAVSEFHFSPASERPAGAGGFVVFEADENGVFRLDFGRPDIQVYTHDGRRVELAELERRVREAGPEAVQAFAVARMSPPGDGTRFEVEIETVRTVRGAEAPRRLILEDPQLASRLESVHRGALIEARTRIDSVLRVQAELARRGELPPNVGYAYELRFDEEAPRPPIRVERIAPSATGAPVSSTYRLAGAEFRTMTPELADYFAVDSGVLVLRVIPETPAQRLGLRGGDVIIEVDGTATPDVTILRSLVGELLARGLQPEVKWNRKGRELSGNLASR